MADQPSNPLQREQNKKSMPMWQKVLIGLGLILVLIISYFGYQIYSGNAIKSEVEPIVITFTEAISAGQIDQAYELTSTEFQEKIPKDELIEYVSFYNQAFTGFSTIENTGFVNGSIFISPKTFTYIGRMVDEKGLAGEVSISFVKENKEWKIIDITYSPIYDN